MTLDNKTAESEGHTQMDYALEHGVSTHYRDIPFQ
jgi:hypothetical protein